VTAAQRGKDEQDDACAGSDGRERELGESRPGDRGEQDEQRAERAEADG
jgi:hypothetical protein